MGDTTTTPSSTVASTESTVSTTTTTAAPTKISYELPFTAATSAAAGWEVVFFAVYGPGEDQIGSGADIGENYGPYEPVIIDRDGFWRVADVYKSRVARFDSTGSYVDSAPTPELMPMAGMVTLDSGDLIAAASGNKIAVITTTGVTLHSAEGAGNPTLIDSFENSAFGFGTNGIIYRYTLTGDELSAERGIDFYQGADGGRYRFGAPDPRTLRLRLPEENAVIDLLPIPDDGSETEVALGEPIRDRQGRTHMIIYGSSIGSPEVQRAVYLRIDRTELAVVAPMPDVLNGWGWSLLTNLSLDNHDNALVTAVDPDGVRVWRYED